MTLDLPEDAGRIIRRPFVDGRFTPETQVIEATLRLFEERELGPPDPTPDLAEGKRQALARPCQDLDAMPAGGVGDEFSDRDHDRILHES